MTNSHFEVALNTTGGEHNVRMPIAIVRPVYDIETMSTLYNPKGRGLRDASEPEKKGLVSKFDAKTGSFDAWHSRWVCDG
jgi:hypothetical protein